MLILNRDHALMPRSKVFKQKVSKPKWLKWVFQFNVERPLYVCLHEYIIHCYYIAVKQYSNVYFFHFFSHRIVSIIILTICMFTVSVSLQGEFLCTRVYVCMFVRVCTCVCFTSSIPN